ncbi:MAG: hypothetical protein QM699_16005 [Amaricoccus sp.]|uniref:hypothetical protein n=1 Tax=Amaricoccus sp. TaxID=1872485 RepID=UPI0039E261D0
MRRKDEERAAAKLAKAMAMICVRNTMLEDIHAGRGPVSRTGDFSDVFVVDAEGNRTTWTEVSRIDDSEMRDLMRQVVNRLYTFQLRLSDPEFQRYVDRWTGATRNWDTPRLDDGFYRANQSRD